MHNNQTIDKIRELIISVINNAGVELVELSYKRQGARMLLRLLVDKPGGITLGECSELNQKLGQLLDGSQVIDQSYILEVSSPGLDRPLTDERDFRRVQGKPVRIITRELINGRNEHSGVVSEVREDRVVIETKQGIAIEIPLDKISKARLEIEF